MIRMLFVLLIVSGLLHIGIDSWRYATGKSRWKFVKTLSYSLGIGTLAIVILSIIVILF